MSRLFHAAQVDGFGAGELSSMGMGLWGTHHFEGGFAGGNAVVARPERQWLAKFLMVADQENR